MHCIGSQLTLHVLALHVIRERHVDDEDVEETQPQDVVEKSKEEEVNFPNCCHLSRLFFSSSGSFSSHLPRLLHTYMHIEIYFKWGFFSLGAHSQAHSRLEKYHSEDCAGEQGNLKERYLFL